MVAIILSSPSFCNAQIAKQQHPTSVVQFSGLSDQRQLKELVSIHQGTYQLRVSNQNYAPILNLALLDTVINSRQQVTNVSFELDEFTRVFIPSFATIGNDLFIPLQTIIYITENTPISEVD